MANKHISIALVCACIVTMQAFAQTTRTEQIDQEKAAKAASVSPEPREKGDIIIERIEHIFMPQPPAWRVTTGNFRPGAGLGAGVAYAAPVKDGLWDTRVAWSIKNFKQAESTLAVPLRPADKLRAATFVRWDDAPSLKFFGLGNSTPHDNEVSYGLRSTEVGADLEGRTLRWLRYGVGVGYLKTSSREGGGSEPSIETRFTDQTAPGLGSRPAWVHSRAFAGIDTRESPGYTTRGGLYGVSYHHYTDNGGQFTFDRAQIDVRQFIPVLHNNWIVALQGRADLTHTEDGQVIPYFMLPSIGGRDTLPGYQEYRFTDRHSLLLRSELRWTVSPLIDMAVFVDHGKVAPRVVDLDLRGMKRDVGVGARFHGPTFTALRLEIAHGSDGWRAVFAHSISF